MTWARFEQADVNDVRMLAESKNITETLKKDGPALEIIREKAIKNDVNLRKQAQNTQLRAGEYLLKSEINPGADSNQKVLKKMDLVA